MKKMTIILKIKEGTRQQTSEPETGLAEATW